MNENVMEEFGIQEYDTAPKSMIATFMGGQDEYYCSINVAGDREKAADVYSMLNDSHTSVSEIINLPINLINVAAYPASSVDGETGEINEFMSVVLMDDKRNCYKCSSVGIAQSLKKLFVLFGMPDDGAWEKNPIPVVIKRVETGNSNHAIFKMEIVRENMNKNKK